MTRGKLIRRLKGAELLESRLMLAGDPVAEWRFDEIVVAAVGTVLNDSTGNGHNASVTGSSVLNQRGTGNRNVVPILTAANASTTQQWGTGTRNGAFRLFSDTDGALVPAANAPQFLSLSFWFKADTTNPTRYTGSTNSGTGTPVAMPLFEMGDDTSGLNAYIYNTRLYVGAWVNGGVSGNETFLFTGANAIVAGRWYFVTLTLDPAGGSTGLKGYLGGVQFSQGTYRNVGAPADIGIGRTDNATRFLLGTSGTSVVNNNTAASNNNRGFAGYLDEMRVYNETLTTTDVVTIRDATAPTAAEEQWLVRDSGRAAAIGRFRFAGQLASEHFVIKWGSETTTGNALDINGFTGANLLTGVQQNLNKLEMAWDIIVDEAGMAPPLARNGVTYKVNLYVLDSGLWFVDASNNTFSGASAGPDPAGFPAMYMTPSVLGGGSQTIAPWGVVANTSVTPHEFTHTLQQDSGGFPGTNPFFETHANFGSSLVAARMAGNNNAQVVDRNDINGRFGQRRHRYASATDFRYEAHFFLNYLYDHNPDYPVLNATTSGLWDDPQANGTIDAWNVLRENFPTFADFAQTYASYVASTVTYKQFDNGALLTGSPSIPTHSTTTRLFREYLEPVTSSPGWWQVPEQDIPEQYGANIIPLTMLGKVSGQTLDVTVNIDGYTNPGQTSGIYATLVAVSGTGAGTQEWFSPTWQNGPMTWTVPAAATNLYLAVTAIPSINRTYIWSHPFYPTGGITQKIERFPYRVSMTNAVPARSETEVDRPNPGGATRHINPDGSAGGWKTVSVPSTVYIAYNAAVTGGTVSGSARIEDRATVTGGNVSGSAIIRGHARVQSGTVTGNAIVDDYAVIAGGVVSEFARVKGDSLVNAGAVRGNALLVDYATVSNSSSIVAGDTVIKGYGAVDAVQMTGNAIVMDSGLAYGGVAIRNTGVIYNGEPASQEVPLETTQYNNLFARYLFTTQDNNAVWEDFNTTYGWVSNSPPQWISSSPSSGNPLTGVLQFASDDQFIELSPELADLRDYTIATWVRWDGTGDINQRIFEFGRDAGNYMYLQPTSGGGGVKFVIGVNGVEHVLQGSAPLAVNQWQHVAVTFEGDTVKLRVNVTAVDIENVTVAPHQIRATYGLLARGQSAGGFRGMIDSLQLYSKALTFNEVLALVEPVFPGYVPNPDPNPNPGASDPILVLEFAVHDSTGAAVQDRQAITNGDLRNSSPVAPNESANPGGMTSSGAGYILYNVATEGLNNKPGADGYSMNTAAGHVYFADAGSPLEQALATSDTFSAFARVKRTSDSGAFELIIGRPDAVVTAGVWSIGIDANDHISVSMGGQSFDTGVQFAVGQWHEVGVSYAGTGTGDGWVYAYVDGKREGAFVPGAIGNQQVLYLGAGLAGVNRFRGLCDHVEFWDYVVDDVTFAALSNVTPSALPGDYTGDGTVDAADYVVWRKTEGQSVTPGTSADGTGDGIVDGNDRSLWVANFGRMQPPAAAAAVAAPVVTAVISAPANASLENAKNVDVPLTSKQLAFNSALGEIVKRPMDVSVANAVVEHLADKVHERRSIAKSHESRANLELIASLTFAHPQRDGSSGYLFALRAKNVDASSSVSTKLNADFGAIRGDVEFNLLIRAKDNFFLNFSRY